MKNWMRVYPFYFLIIQYSFLPGSIFSSPGQSEGKFSLQFLYSSRAMPWILEIQNWSYTKFNIFIIKTIRCVLCSVFIWKWFEILSVDGVYMYTCMCVYLSLCWKILTNTEHKILNFENTVFAQMKLITKLQVPWLWYVIHFHIHFTNTLNPDYGLLNGLQFEKICMLYLLSVN